MMKILTVDDEKVELAPVDICQELLDQTYEEKCSRTVSRRKGTVSRAPFLRGPLQITASSRFGSMKPMDITPKFSFT